LAAIPHRGSQGFAPKKNADATTPSLIRWSIQEVRRLAIRLAKRSGDPAHIIASSPKRATVMLAQL